MHYDNITEFIKTLKSYKSEEVRWCDEARFNEENQEDVSPGGWLNPYGYFVIGTTIGGNAVVIGTKDPRVCFADHAWYTDDEISYQDVMGDEEWHDLPYNTQNLFKSLCPLSSTRQEFIEKISSGVIDEIIEEID